MNEVDAVIETSALEMSATTDDLETAEEMYGNKSPILGVYSKGEHLVISDNEQLYEIAKMIKDFTDKHFYNRNFKYGIKIAYNTLEFKVVDDKSKPEYIRNYHLEGIIQYVLEKVNLMYQEKFDTEILIRDLKNNKRIITLIIKEKR